MKKGRNRSIVWTQLTDEEFVELVKSSETYVDIRRFFGFINTGNVRTIKQRIKKLNIDVSHFARGDFSYRTNYKSKTKPLEDVMVVDSEYSRGTLKNRLIRLGLIKNECSICGLKDIWNNKNIVMVLDHINGISNDHRLENLRMVCPNCNSQLDTFCRKNSNKNIKIKKEKKIKIKKEKKIYLCSVCGGEKKSKIGSVCGGCAKIKQRKVNRPTKELLMRDINELGYKGCGRKYGVSDNAIRKWLK